MCLSKDDFNERLTCWMVVRRMIDYGTILVVISTFYINKAIILSHNVGTSMYSVFQLDVYAIKKNQSITGNRYTINTRNYVI